MGGRNGFDFNERIGVDLVLCSSRKRLDFSVWIQINSIFVSGHRTRHDSGVGIEIELIYLIRSKLTFVWWIELDMVLVLLIEANMCFVRRSNELRFCVRAVK